MELISWDVIVSMVMTRSSLRAAVFKWQMVDCAITGQTLRLWYQCLCGVISSCHLAVLCWLPLDFSKQEKQEAVSLGYSCQQWIWELKDYAQTPLSLKWKKEKQKKNNLAKTNNAFQVPHSTKDYWVTLLTHQEERSRDNSHHIGCHIWGVGRRGEWNSLQVELYELWILGRTEKRG